MDGIGIGMDGSLGGRGYRAPYGANKSNYINIAKATRLQKQIKIKTCQIKYIKLNMPPQLINIALKLNKFVMSIVAIFGKVLSNMILSVGVIPGDFALRGFPSVPSPFQGLPCNNTWYLKNIYYFFSFY